MLLDFDLAPNFAPSQYHDQARGTSPAGNVHDCAQRVMSSYCSVLSSVTR
jgi:hypothetical protein